MVNYTKSTVGVSKCRMNKMTFGVCITDPESFPLQDDMCSYPLRLGKLLKKSSKM